MVWFYLLALLGSTVPADALHKTTVVALRVTGGTRAWFASVPLIPNAAALAGSVPDSPKGVPVPLLRGAPTLMCVGADDRATTCRVLRPTSDQDENFVLVVGRVVRGRCLVGKKAAARAHVRLRFADLDTRTPYMLPVAFRDGHAIAEVSTNDNGVFEIPQISPGRYVVEVHLLDGRTVSSDPFRIVPPRPSETTIQPLQLPDLRVEAGISVIVQTRDANGAVTASIGVSQPATFGRVANIIETHTDKDGNANVSGIDATRPMTVTCAEKGYSRQMQHFDAAPAMVTCRMLKLAQAHGLVTDEYSEPIEHATVALKEQRFVTDSTGQFRATDIAPGKYTMRVSAPKHRLKTVDVELGDGETRELQPIELEAGAEVHGEVHDAQTGVGIDGVVVHVVDPPGDAATTAGGGEFDLVVDPAARMTVEAHAAGYAAARLQSVGTTPLQFHLEHAGQIEATVWDEDSDTLCVACTVVASTAGIVYSEESDEAGIARFDDVVPGDFLLTRERASATTTYVKVSGGGDSVRATVKPGSLTRVTLGTRSTLTTVILQPTPDSTWSLFATNDTSSSSAERDAEGDYVIHRKPGAAYKLTLVRQTTGTIIASIGPDFHDNIFTASVPSGVVRATLTAKGKPAGGLLVTIVNDSGPVAWSVTDESGEVVFNYVKGGAYRLSVKAAQERTIPVLVAEGRTNDAGMIDLSQP